MQDLGLEDDLDEENNESSQENQDSVSSSHPPSTDKNTEIRALNGEIAADEFAADAINYQVLIDKIDVLLEKLKLDA